MSNMQKNNVSLMNKKYTHCWHDFVKICRFKFRDMRWIDKYIPPPPLKGNKIEYKMKILLEMTIPYLRDQDWQTNDPSTAVRINEHPYMIKLIGISVNKNCLAWSLRSLENLTITNFILQFTKIRDLQILFTVHSSFTFQTYMKNL